MPPACADGLLRNQKDWDGFICFGAPAGGMSKLHCANMNSGSMQKPTVYEIRRENLKNLVAGRGAKAALAIKLNASPAHISHMISSSTKNPPKPIHEDKARELETALGQSAGSLDHECVRATIGIALAPIRSQVVAGASADHCDSRDWRILNEVLHVFIAAALEHRLPANAAIGALPLVYERSRNAGMVDAGFVSGLVKLLKSPKVSDE